MWEIIMKIKFSDIIRIVQKNLNQNITIIKTKQRIRPKKVKY